MTSPALPTIFGETYHQRTDGRFVGDECVVCGAHTGCFRKRSWWVRLDETLGAPIPADDPRDEDGGCFPVGPECRRKFPPEYLLRLEPPTDR